MAEATHADSRADKASPDRARGRKDVATPGNSPAPVVIPAAGEGVALTDVLALTDDHTRADVVLEMQRVHGNAYVQRVLEPSEAQEAKAEGEEITGSSFGPPVMPPVDPRHALFAGQVKWGRHAQFPGVMGQTYYARKDIEMWPAFRTVTERSIYPWGWRANIARTDAAGGIWDALATPENEEGYKMPAERPEYPGYEVYVRESGSAANNIAQAEQQHINDLDTGWAITGLAAKNAINEAAGEEPEVRGTEMEAKRAAVDKAAGKMGGLGSKIRGALESGGRLEDALGPMMDNSFVQSKTQRDDAGKHKIPVNYVMKDDENKRVLYEVDPNHNLDSTDSGSVVNLGSLGP